MRSEIGSNSSVFLRSQVHLATLEENKDGLFIRGDE